ncbi:hypothetical protein [Methyloversatilis sp. XJ19-49]|uniref:hypothetical protein n=1 Tax=Methyloversatilis sp. XJ19-49 TaxID=2963429 RepID=UPI00211CE733|nr:hypothetical protein [Methyloversatilis sp. XJ19-49]MCQ9377772.1 hypothetical protein [Methyloversatilis sp. XJ19-49]
MSNRTDNDSANMATGKGVIQGYTNVAAVDAAHQTTVSAVRCADAGYHSERNLTELATRHTPA